MSFWNPGAFPSGFFNTPTSYNPLTNSNLKVWVEMDSGVTNSGIKVSTIANQASTGSTYDAIARSGDTSTNLPVYSLAGGQRNKPYAYFDASQSQRLMLRNPYTFAAGTGFDIFIKCAPQRKQNTTQPILFGNQNGNSTFQWTSFKSIMVRSETSGNITFDGTTTQQIGTLDDQTHIYRLSRKSDGSTCTISTDKMVIAQFTMTGDFVLDSIGYSNGLSLMHGSFYWLAAYDAYQGDTRTETYPATLTEAGKVEDYICDKYDFAQHLVIQATESTSNCTVSAGIDSSYGVTGQMSMGLRAAGYNNYTIFNEAVVGSTLALSGTRADADATVSGNIFGIRKRNYRFKDKPILFAWCGGNDIGAANSTILTRYTTYVDACNTTGKFKVIYGATIYIAMGAPGDTNAAAGYPIISSWNAYLKANKPTNMSAIADVGAQTHLSAGVDVMDVTYYYAGDPQVQHLNHRGNAIVASLFVTTITPSLVADATTFTQLPLDTVPGASAAFALLKLRAGYTGSCIRVRRSSDDTEQDIGFDANGFLDTSALTSFVGANNGFVTKWYDQSRYSNDAVQATKASQPKIVNAGSVITANSLPTIQFDGSSSTLDLGSSGQSLIKACIGATCFTVGKSSNAGAVQNFVYFSKNTDATAQRFGLTKNASNQYAGGFRPLDTDSGGVATGSTDTANTLGVNTVTANDWIPSVTIFRNGAQAALDKTNMTINPDVTNTKKVENTNSAAARIGASGSTAANFLNGTLSAAVIYTSELTDISRHTLEQVAGSAYGITIS